MGESIFLTFIIVFLVGLFMGVVVGVSLSRPNYPRY